MPLILLLTIFIFIFSGSFVPVLALDLESNGVDIGVGYRCDQLDWSIAPTTEGGEPSILSELSWDDIEILQIQIAGWLEFAELPVMKKNGLLQLDLAIGKIISGTVRDSDYATDNRTNEWSRSDSDADNGYTVDVSGAIGSILRIEKISGLSFIPSLGYSFNMQELTMTNGVQTISDGVVWNNYFGSKDDNEIGLPHGNGHIDGLDSSYTAYWYGPWLGIDTVYQVPDKLKIVLGIEYHWIDFFAEADWNLRTDFKHPVSFEHDAKGTGIVWKIEGEFELSQNWSYLFSGNIQNWRTDSGTDRVYFADGLVGVTRLNKVNWESCALTAGVQYRF